MSAPPAPAVSAPAREPVDVSAIIAAHPCAAQVEALEACLGSEPSATGGRPWAACRAAVAALRACDRSSAAARASAAPADS